MVRQLHDGMTPRVTDNGVTSEAFEMTNGVKQRYVLTPPLFSLVFSATLTGACCDECPGIRIVYKRDSQLLNCLWVHVQSRLSTTNVHELLFAAACDNFGMVISTEEMVVMHQLPLDAVYAAPQINVNGAQLKAMDSFTYLSSMLTRNTKIEDEVTRPRLGHQSALLYICVPTATPGRHHPISPVHFCLVPHADNQH
nr:unnamed protein product [Spirometra erinaceieuropaei]